MGLYCRVVTVLRTSPLLDALRGIKSGLWKGSLRNSLILPALYLLHSWVGFILVFQVFWYWQCGRSFPKNQTRIAEGITGFVLGVTI